MKPLLLNIGCGDKKLNDFVNIDVNSDADIRFDVTHGIPFPDNSATAIYCEHFIEHLTQSEAIKFLRECRRVLVPEGTVRIATPDLDDCIEQYMDDWKGQAWIKDFGYEWVDNRCEVLNIVMREWGHKWLFNQEELVRLGSLAGLSFSSRWGIGESQEDRLKGLEWRKDSRLILEFNKRWIDGTHPSEKVSILIPAYNYDFFETCLESAVHQTYQPIEIIICDDSAGEHIGNIVQSVSASDKRIKYFKNEKNIGSFRNYIKCFSKATGSYIKFLNDDDVLHATCVARMVDCLKRYPEATLVTSHRQFIDARGRSIKDSVVTQRPVQEDSLINGATAVDYMLGRCINFIGEPTTAMFRRDDLTGNRPNLLSFAGRTYDYNVDVVMWTNLLSKGDLIYLHDSLSYFRLHEKQEQRLPGGVEKGTRAWHLLRHDGARMGLLDLHQPKVLKTLPLARFHSETNGKRDLWGTPEYKQNYAAFCRPAVDTPERSNRKASDSPNDGPAINPLIDDYLKKGRDHFFAGNLKSASDCFRHILDIDETHLEAIKSLGIIAYEADLLDSADFFFKSADAINPSDRTVKEYLRKCASKLLPTEGN